MKEIKFSSHRDLIAETFSAGKRPDLPDSITSREDVSYSTVLQAMRNQETLHYAPCSRSRF